MGAEISFLKMTWVSSLVFFQNISFMSVSLQKVINQGTQKHIYKEQW